MPRRRCIHPCRIPRAWLVTGAAILCATLTGLGHPRAAGSLATVSPSGASPAVTINITGTGFDTTAANNEVAFIPATGSGVTVRGSSIVLINAGTGTRRLAVTVPPGLPAGRVALRVTNLTTQEISEGLSIDIVGIGLHSVSSAPRGSSNLSVRMTGTSNSRFVAGSSRAAFGAGITVHSTTVESATSLVASISVAGTAALGPRTVGVISPTQTATLASALTVTAAGTPPNHAPSASAGGSYSVQSGVSLTLTGSGSDPDAGDSLTFTWSFGDGSKPINGAQVSHTYATAGTYTATLTVSDGKGGSAPSTAQVTVTAPPPPNNNPSITSSAVTVATEGQAYAYDVNAADPDVNDVLTYTLVQSPAGMIISATTGEIAWTPAQAGQEPVTVRVSDGKGGSAEQSFTIATATANRAPVIVSAPVPTASAGQAFTYDIDATDDVGDTLTYELTQAPSGMSIDPSSGVIGWTPEANHIPSAAVTVQVSDGKGGIAALSFTINVAAAALGRGVIAGRVFDDATGLPIEDANVQLLSVDGNPPADAPKLEALSDLSGRFRLSAAPGVARLRIVKAGHTKAERRVRIVGGKRVDLFDARLTRLDGRINAVASVGGAMAVSASGDIRLAIPAESMPEDRDVQLTRVSAHGLMLPLPLGWSPVAAVDVFPSGMSFSSAALLSVPSPAGLPGDRTVTVVFWDESTGTWVAGGTAERSADGKDLQAPLSRAGQHAFVLPDAPPGNPPAAILGQPLAALSPRPPPADLGVTITPSPRVLFAQPGARSRVGVLAASSVPLPSGTPFLLELVESYTFSSDGVLHLRPTEQRLALYGFSAGGTALNLRSEFFATPSREFAPFALRLGAIDLAVRVPAEPAAPLGTVIGSSGGVASGATGERASIPAGATVDDLPVVLARIEPADFPLALPSGLSLIRALTFDLHGAALGLPATLSVPAPEGLTTGDSILVAELAEADGESRLALVAIGAVQGTDIVTVVDPKGDGSLRFRGVRGEGRYAFLKASLPIAFLTGLVSGDGGVALANALVRVDSLALVALTDGDGRYVLASPLGEARVTATKIDSGDTAAASATLTTAGAVSTVPVSLGATPPVVIAVTPANGSAAVPLASAVRITFSEPVDPASLTPDALVIFDGAAATTGTISLAPGHTVVTFRPAGLLSSQAIYQVRVAGTIRDLAGNPMGAPFVSQFSTVDLTAPPPPEAGAIAATIPDANGTFTITGSQGTADPGGLVLVKNVRTGATTTLTPNANGSFTGTIAALRTDRVEITISDAAGNKTTLPLPAFRNADGSVVVGESGGRVEGAGGVFVDVPPGALPDGTVVKVEPLGESELELPAPAQFPFIGGVRLDLGGVTPRESLDVGIPAPSGASPQDQVLVVRPLQLRTRRAWTLADRAHLKNGRYETASPPFVGIAGEGSYSFLSTQGSCISYVTIRYQLEFHLVVVPSGLPFVFPVTTAETMTLPAYCDSTLSIEVLDPDTNQIIRQITEHAPADRDEIADSSQIATTDRTAPRIIGSNNLTTYRPDQVELRFSEPMNADSVIAAFVVEDSDGTRIDGTVEVREGLTLGVFRPAAPFRLGEQYSVAIFGATDRAGNFLEGQQITFTPFAPRSLSHLNTNLQFRAALEKCTAGGGCSTSAIDEGHIGDTLFMANGLRFGNEQYTNTANPSRLVVADVTDPFAPVLIGTHPTQTNPRTLAPVPGVNFFLPNGFGFNGDMLLVAGGGRVPAGELPGKLEIYDVTACTARPLAANVPDPAGGLTTNCLAAALTPLEGRRFLSTVPGLPPLSGVPPDAGTPLQMAVLHDKGPGGTTSALVAYVLVSPIGIEAVDVIRTFNVAPEDPANNGPDGILRGDFLDLAVLKNRVVAVERNPAGDFALSVFAADLSRTLQVPLPGLASRVATVENMVFDIDGDGNLGLAEDEDTDPLAAKDEIFDFAIVSSGPLSEGQGCALSVPCGELYVIDLSAATNLAHGGAATVIARIPLQGPAFGVQVDTAGKTAYVEIRGHGLGIVDLGFLLGVLNGSTHVAGLIDQDANGLDDRVLRIVAKSDILATDVRVDTSRGIAYVNGSSTGLELIQIDNDCSDLLLDFRPNPRSAAGDLGQEQRLLLTTLQNVVAALVAGGIRREDIALLEQGSGSCFWRGDIETSCNAFTAGSSDHDIEVFVPMGQVAAAQGVLDAYIRSHRTAIAALGDFSLFAMPRESFVGAELLNGTPMNGSGDATGDLAMGRQSLLLLWLLEGAYVDDPNTPEVDYQGGLPDLQAILERLQTKTATHEPVFNGESTGIPGLEGYEWALLQEFNFYKSGALVRIKGACDPAGALNSMSGSDIPPTDADHNQNESGILLRNCEDELRTVAKAAIRSVLARLIADKRANAMILKEGRQVRNGSGDVIGMIPLTIAQYRNNLCLGVGNPLEPPAIATEYEDKRCDSFEEFIMSMAVESVRRGHGIFAGSDLPLIYSFYCVKVAANCADTRGLRVDFIIRTDQAANEFIAKAIAFIETRVKDLTKEVYDETLANDSKPLASLVPPGQEFPFLTAGLNGGPGIVAICASAGVGGITLESTRGDLRRCNAAIVAKKVTGADNITIEPVDVIKSTASRKALEKQMGVRRYVKKNLRVRAINRSPHTVPAAQLTMYEGDGLTLEQYAIKREFEVAFLRGSEQRVLASEPDPDSTDSDRPIFPTFFDTSALQSRATASSPRAIVFFLDPDRRIPEENKKDNQAAFFYYILNRQSPSGVPQNATPAFPIEDTSPDSLCIDRPPIKFDLTAKAVGGPGQLGVKELPVSVAQQVLLTYRIENLGNEPLRNVLAERAGQAVFRVAELPPGGVHVHTEPFTPRTPGTYTFLATVTATTAEGDSIGPEYDRVFVTATEGNQLFGVELFDYSPLREPTHPFSRFAANHDDDGRDVPLIGSVTDGDEAGGGGRLRVLIKRLKPGIAIDVAIADAELAGVSDGIGWLEHGEQAAVLNVSGVMPDIFGEATVYYTPPPVFVRDAHTEEDFGKVERRVKLSVTQNTVGVTVHGIVLRRPPVFLVHGLFSRKETWDNFQPLVPAGDLGPGSFKGFDGRFDVFRLGTLFASDRFAKGADELKFQMKFALGEYLPGFSIGRVDVIGHSMGAVLVRRLASEFLTIGPSGPVAPDQKNVPFRKLIAIDAPFQGSPLADKIVEIRERALVKAELPPPGAQKIDWLNVADQGPLTPPVKAEVSVEGCALLVQAIGVTPKFLIRGALDDLKSGSDELLQIAAAGIQVPTHHVVGQTVGPGLGAGPLVTGLWAALGQFCDLTPDETTVEATQLVKLGVEAAKALVPFLKISKARKLAKGSDLLPVVKQAENTKAAIKRFEAVAEFAAKDPQTEFTKVFSSPDNDRIVGEESQRAGLSQQNAAVSFVVGPTDHNEMLQNALAPSCSPFTTALPGAGDANGDGQPDATCRVIFLLEAAPTSKFFFKSPGS